MRAIRKKLMQPRGGRLIWLAGALALMTANASAQSLPPINLLQLQRDQKHLTPEEQEQRCYEFTKQLRRKLRDRRLQSDSSELCGIVVARTGR